MKKNNLLLFFVFVSISISAQSIDTKGADKLVESHDYVQAVQDYQALIEKGNTDPYVMKQLGDCYYYMNNTVDAEKWYNQALNTKQDPETYYRYAQILKSNGKYAESNAQMKTFAALMPNDKRAKEFNDNPNYLAKLIGIKTGFTVSKISVNSDRSDFGAILHNDMLYFASARNESNKIYGWNNEPFLDIYQSTYNADGTYADATPVVDLNSKFHEGPVSVTKDGNVIYFSSESFKDKLFISDKVQKLRFGQVNLFKATNENGKWVNTVALSFNSKSYSTGNPSIDKEGKTLYFASNMPGSIGGTDLWKVAVNDDGTFGIPENLGNSINTTGDENFPFITDDNILYFSSNGITGFGGLDIFSVDLNSGGIPKNVGQPINSAKDDFAFTFNKEKNIGYISSNRSGIDHIYSAVPICYSQIAAVVKNSKTADVLVNSRVAVLDENKVVLDKQLSNDRGEVLFNVECQKGYTVEVYKDGFISNKTSIAKTTSGMFTVEVSLEPVDVIVTEIEIILSPIYFEFNKSSITKQSAEELDKLVYVMSQNEDLIIYAKSHTDSSGEDDYNMSLSERRANSTVKYIISKGISSERISGKGFGESELKVNCGVDCTEDEHALNRRSEFIIVKK
ncbi:MAG: outer membrane protein OmpA-like peptidoglycan-associated protein [Flavobacterium sp.]|jgi:outer membrane protein OmpA-like peptidoglycan-associated protein/tetratricopeptide (TPR) repeat protein